MKIFSRGIKCLCCNNPWNQDGTDLPFALTCEPCKEDTGGVKGISPEDFDETISPADNFYLHAVGGWRKNNPVPPEYPNWAIFTKLHDENQKKLKALVDELEAGEQGPLSGDERKVVDFFCTAMDEAAIE